MTQVSVKSTLCQSLHWLISKCLSCSQLFPFLFVAGLLMWADKKKKSRNQEKSISFHAGGRLPCYLLLSDSGCKRRYWVHPINCKQAEYGEFHKLVNVLKEFPDRFFQYFCMSKEQFEFLLEKISPCITGSGTNFCKSITPEEKLAVCLRYTTCSVWSLFWLARRHCYCLHHCYTRI